MGIQRALSGLPSSSSSKFAWFSSLHYYVLTVLCLLFSKLFLPTWAVHGKLSVSTQGPEIEPWLTGSRRKDLGRAECKA